MSMPFTKSQLLVALVSGLAVSSLASAQNNPNTPTTLPNVATTNTNIATMLSNFNKNKVTTNSPTEPNPTISTKTTSKFPNPTFKTVGSTVNTTVNNTVNTVKPAVVNTVKPVIANTVKPAVTKVKNIANSNISSNSNTNLNTNVSNASLATPYQYGANVYQLGRLYYNLGGQLGLGYNNEFGVEAIAGFKAIAPFLHSANQKAHINFINFLNLHQNTKYSKFGLGLGVGASYDLTSYHVTFLGDLHVGLGVNFIYHKNPNKDLQHNVLGLDIGSYTGVRFYNLFEVGLLYTNFSLSRYYASTDIVFTYYF